jgi:hypothetical protein
MAIGKGAFLMGPPVIGGALRVVGVKYIPGRRFRAFHVVSRCGNFRPGGRTFEKCVPRANISGDERRQPGYVAGWGGR